jgi:hypothetical protein
VVADDAGARATGSVTVEVDPVPHPPVARPDAAVVPEDGGSVAVDVLANDSDPDGDPLSVASYDGSSIGHGSLAWNGARTFTYSPAADFTGTETFGYVISDGAGGQATAVVTITVTPTDDPPTFALGALADVAEDAGPQVVAGWVADVSAGPPDEADQGVSLSLAVDDPTLFAAAPGVDASGTLTYTPAPDANGTATLTVTATDDGGATSERTTTLTITPVDDVPSFTVGAPVGVAEDGGPQSVAGWVSGISPGPADEAGQTVSFTVVVDDPTLFAAAPSVDASGTLTYTPAPDRNGTATLTIAATDDGGSTSGPSTTTLTITAVDDAPTFLAGASQWTNEDSGPHTVPGWITAISAGPADEAAQTVSFTVTVDDPTLFATPPSVDPSGSLAYVLAADQNGTATLTITATDSGGATSVAQTAALTVAPVDDAPSFTIGSAVTTAEDAGPQTVGSWINGISAGPSDELGQVVTFAVAVDDPSLFAAGPVVDAAGTLTFTPADDANGTATLTVTASDSGGASSADQAATITITAVQDAPVAQDDSVATQQDAPITVPVATGLLANDFDVDGDPLVVTAVGPATGAVAWNPDGSFTYTPLLGSTAADTFTYTVSDGQSAPVTATVTIQISAAPITAATYYLRPGAPAADDWVLGAPSPDGTILDYDADGHPGLTIKKSNGALDQSDPRKFQNFDLVPASDLVLDGPVTVSIVASTGGLLGAAAHPHLYLQDCATDGSGCIDLASTNVHVNSWSGLLSTWAERSFTLGNVNHTITASRMLRLVVLNDHSDLWIAMSSGADSRIDITTS